MLLMFSGINLRDGIKERMQQNNKIELTDEDKAILKMLRIALYVEID